MMLSDTSSTPAIPLSFFILSSCLSFLHPLLSSFYSFRVPISFIIRLFLLLLNIFFFFLFPLFIFFSPLPSWFFRVRCFLFSSSTSLLFRFFTCLPLFPSPYPSLFCVRLHSIPFHFHFFDTGVLSLSLSCIHNSLGRLKNTQF